jgi:4-hydroxybenzoate polyprenyltransferase
MEFLNKFLPYLYIIRSKNLLIVAANQLIISFMVIRPELKTPALSIQLTLLLILDTVILTAGGNLINDIFDRKTDAVNKPDKYYIGPYISLKSAWIYYAMLQIAGLCVAFYIALAIRQLHLVLIYPLAVLLLFYYSFSLKRRLLAGNILVSLFTAMVSGIMLFAERNAIASAGPHIYKPLYSLILAYMTFSFVINLMREIIKDMEDVTGDIQAGCRTTPIVLGTKKTTLLVQILGLISLVLLSIWVIWSDPGLDFRAQIFILLFCGSPLLIVIRSLNIQANKQNYGRISSILKWIMVAGLGSLVLIASNT